MHRFFVDPSSIHHDQFKTTDKDLCHQISKVLKMRVGKQVILCNNSETEYTAEWTLVSKSACEAAIHQRETRHDIGTLKPVNLFVSPLKNQNRWETILDMATQLGVASFTPLITKRTEVTELRKPERLHRIITEAAEQSGRTRLPELFPPMSLEQLLSIPTPANSINLIASLHEGSQSIPEAIAKAKEKLTMTKIGINIFIGPVGDFTEEEVQASIEHNFYSISLGEQVLRTETAAIVAAALALS